MKVLVSDNLGEAGLKIFDQEPEIDVDVKTGLGPDEIKKIIGEYDALVIRSATKVTEELLTAAKKLRAIGRAGIGLDNVDIPAATKRGILVMNTPTGNVITIKPEGRQMGKENLARQRSIQQSAGYYRVRQNRIHRCGPCPGLEDASDCPRPVYSG